MACISNGHTTANGIPDIDPDKHQLLIHGLVRRPLSFTVEQLARYLTVSRMAFIECGGNGGALYQKAPVQLGPQGLHGLVSCAEWTGVPLAVLLEEAGVDPRAMDPGGRCGRRKHESQRAAGQGDG